MFACYQSSFLVIVQLKLWVGNPLSPTDGVDENHLPGFLTDLRYGENIQTEAAFFT